MSLVINFQRLTAAYFTYIAVPFCSKHHDSIDMNKRKLAGAAEIAPLDLRNGWLDRINTQPSRC